MSVFCSTSQASERSGATYRQLDYYVRTRLVSPPQARTTGEIRAGLQGRTRRWRPVDVAAAAAVVRIISADPGGRATDLARLASTAVYEWHGRVPFVVLALPDVVEAAGSTEEACRIADGHTVATLVALDG